MSGSGEWDKRMTDTLKNFDLNSPEVKQQFSKTNLSLYQVNSTLNRSDTQWLNLYLSDQIGLTPEEVISKIMENPDVAMAFQNPRVQAALMEVRFLLTWIRELLNFTPLLSSYKTETNYILVVVAVLREPNEHHEVPKRQRGNNTATSPLPKKAITFLRNLRLLYIDCR